MGVGVRRGRGRILEAQSDQSIGINVRYLHQGSILDGLSEQGLSPPQPWGGSQVGECLPCGQSFRQQTDVPSPEGGGVDGHERRLLGQQPGQGRQSRLPYPFSDGADGLVIAGAVLVYLADGRAGDDVVELVETEQLPGAGQFSVGILVVGRQGSPGGEKLGVVQEELTFAIGAFDVRLAGVGATVIFQIKLAVPDRQSLASLRLEIPEEFAGAA